MESSVRQEMVACFGIENGAESFIVSELFVLTAWSKCHTLSHLSGYEDRDEGL